MNTLYKGDNAIIIRVILIIKCPLGLRKVKA
jgi:hypothetical protein